MGKILINAAHCEVIMKFLSTMFSDINGDPSTNRFISTFVVVFPVLVWSWPILKTGVWVPMPDEVLYLCGGGMASKIIQRKIEESGKCDLATEKIKEAMRRYLEKKDGN